MIFKLIRKILGIGDEENFCLNVLPNGIQIQRLFVTNGE